MVCSKRYFRKLCQRNIFTQMLFNVILHALNSKYLLCHFRHLLSTAILSDFPRNALDYFAKYKRESCVRIPAFTSAACLRCRPNCQDICRQPRVLFVSWYLLNHVIQGTLFLPFHQIRQGVFVHYTFDGIVKLLP